MESYQNAASASTPASRSSGACSIVRLPPFAWSTCATEYAEEGPDVVISRDLAAAIGERLGTREQVLVLLNRRGYSTAVFCRQCGDTFECPNCSVSLTVHRARPRQRVARALPLLQLLRDGPEDVPQVRGAVSRARRVRHRAD